MPRNPCPFGGGDSHPSLLLLQPGFSTPVGPRVLTNPLQPNRSACLPDHGLAPVPWGIGGGLSPVHCLSGLARPVSCYALLRGWLLLSLPPGCLSQPTSFRLTLGPHSRPLTPLCVVPLSAEGLTPPRPTLGVFSGCTFGVAEESRSSRIHDFHCVLYRTAYFSPGMTEAPFGRNQVLPL